MRRRKVIIDCDPGVDDAFALFYAMAQENLDILCVSTVSGNVNVEITTDNARRLVAMAKKNIEVAKGANHPLIGEPFYASYIHGNNGMGDHQYANDDKAALSEMSAVEALYEHLKRSDEPVSLIAMGPLTNIAILLLRYPEIKEKIEVLSLMGGGLKGGNTTAAAEFNFFVDPEAARVVFESGINIIMAGLDVTEKAYIDKTHLDSIRNTSPIGSFLADVIVAARKQNSIDFRTSLHDVVAVMALDYLNIFKYKELAVNIETQGHYSRGMTIADQRLHSPEKGAVKVLLDVDHEQFLNLLYQALAVYK